MKKLLFSVLLSTTLIFSGCDTHTSETNQEDASKSCKIEIYSAQDDALLTTIEEQNTVNELLKTYEWESTDSLPENLTPEYLLVVYQEKTLLLGEDPEEEREYEVIETLITFQDSPYVQQVISGSVIKNMKVPENALTTYHIMPDEVISDFQELLN